MSGERRRALRQDMHWEAVAIDAEGSVISRCMMVNVSATGAKLILPRPNDMPECFVLVLSKKGKVRRQCEVTWRAEKSIGVRFIMTTPAVQESASYIDDMLARLSSKSEPQGGPGDF